MNSIDTLAAIKRHGLAIRQIPETITSLFHIRHAKPDSEIITRSGQKYVREVRTPGNAGFWMCQQVTNTSSMVQWSVKRHHLAATLEESVALFIEENQHD